MKKWWTVSLASLALVGCMAATACAEAPAVSDGVYRGSFTDPKQVEVEFEIKDNVFTSFKFRALTYKDSNYLKSDVELEKKLTRQYQAVLDYLVGKPLSALADVYKPGDFVEDIDAFSGVTICSNKIISAINSALSRGAYKLAAE